MGGSTGSPLISQVQKAKKVFFTFTFKFKKICLAPSFFNFSILKATYMLGRIIGRIKRIGRIDRNHKIRTESFELERILGRIIIGEWTNQNYSEISAEKNRILYQWSYHGHTCTPISIDKKIFNTTWQNPLQIKHNKNDHPHPGSKRTMNH